jgi:hypothetical protein
LERLDAQPSGASATERREATEKAAEAVAKLEQKFAEQNLQDAKVRAARDAQDQLVAARKDADAIEDVAWKIQHGPGRWSRTWSYETGEEVTGILRRDIVRSDCIFIETDDGTLRGLELRKLCTFDQKLVTKLVSARAFVNVP